MVGAYTIGELIKKGMEALNEGEFNNPLFDSRILLCHVLNVDKIHTYTHKDELVHSCSVDNFFKLIEKRKSGYPIQYILGKQEFMGLDFHVREGVLVPRPDTEVLVEYIIDLVKSNYFGDKDIIKIADIGTGSGAITLSLAHHLKNVHVYSVDISDTALQVASENSKSLHLESKVSFLKGDLFQPLNKLKLDSPIDIIVSNPPYIPTNDIMYLQKEVAEYEPKLALDGGQDGLDFYRRIIDQFQTYLSDNGVLAMEIGYDQGPAIKKLLEDMIDTRAEKEETEGQESCPNQCKKNGPSCIEIIKDLAGHDRVVVFKK
ncbi:MAG: peptide chain release factor N(5)-glutamine methyltransferase [Tissierellales bacterium]